MAENLGLVASDPYAASVTAALSSMNINAGTLGAAGGAASGLPALPAGAAANIGGANVAAAAAAASAAHAASNAPLAAAANNATMNNGRKDTTHADVQKLQQQLNDIKEQVSFSMFRLILSEVCIVL